MASTTTIPEVSTNEGPGGDDGRIAGSAATAEAADSEEETWYTPQDAVEAGRSVKADLLRGTSTLNLTGGVVRLATKGPWLLVKSRKGGSAKGYSHSLVDAGATNGKFYDAKQLADELYAVVANVASKCRCNPATPRVFAKPIGLDDRGGMVKYKLCTSGLRLRRPYLLHPHIRQILPNLSAALPSADVDGRYGAGGRGGGRGRCSRFSARDCFCRHRGSRR